ncbi:MAG: hypothetical protein KatS3mg035_0832 [Bacteroidia bacterium]|nr:MAG: hypothetical protein KatS3mg035_0832 [Bacteroidia bacterium]
MNKYIFLFVFLFFNLLIKAQDMKNAANVNYVLGDLEVLDKIELTKIYVAKLNKLSSITPYIPFGELQPKTPSELRIPATSINEKAMDSYSKTIQAYNQDSDAALSNLIPYADKKDIMDAIMFMQEMIAKIEAMGEKIKNQYKKGANTTE